MGRGHARSPSRVLTCPRRPDLKLLDVAAGPPGGPSGAEGNPRAAVRPSQA